MNKEQLTDEVRRLLSMDETAFESELRAAHPEIPEDLVLEDNALEVMSLIMDNLKGSPDV